MKKFAALLMLPFICQLATAQHIRSSDYKMLQQREDSLKGYSVKLIMGINASDRFNADSNFTRMLVRALKIPNSFYYAFDSLETISQLYAPDSSFRIFTWQLVINDNVVRQHGAIQMRTDDGSLKLFRLIDKSAVTVNIADTIGNNDGWIGAIYYKIIQKKAFDKDYYTLLGFDEYSIKSDRKIIEVLSFVNGAPVFGGRIFSIEDDALAPKRSISRYVMEYKKDAGPRLSYDPDLDMIIAEHLISESGEPNKKWTLVGDGDYEGFKWNNGRWIHVNKVYNYVTPLGKEPVPKPLKENNGNLIDNKLIDPDEDKPATEVKPAKPKKKGGL